MLDMKGREWSDLYLDWERLGQHSDSLLSVLRPLVRLGGVPSRGLGPAAERYGAQDGPHHWD